jgi:aldose 1-epimerase
MRQESVRLLEKEKFTKTIDGKAVSLFTLRNKNGLAAQFTNYGARWLSIWVPDKNGHWSDVVLGFDSLEGYLNAKEKYYGAIVGRVCGRIGQGTFSLNGETYHLAKNDLFGTPVKNHLHGGTKGFSFQVWDARQIKNSNEEDALELSYLSVDGEEGYPGNLEVKVTYTLTNNNEIKIDYSAATDKPTPINLSNHAYFNLHGDMTQTVVDHLLCIHAKNVIECNGELTPTGNLLTVADTPLDFTDSRRISSRIDEEFPGQLFAGKGYVTAFVLDPAGSSLKLAASLEEEKSGRVMEVYTDQPSLQFYNAWLFDGTDLGKNGQRYYASSGLALEAQAFPDAPKHSHFPPIVLTPEEIYHQETIYRFSVRSS